MSTMSVVGQTSSQSMVSQSFSSSSKIQQTRRSDMKTPEGDLGDVEADFQSLVNEMSKDGIAKQKSMQTSSQIMESSHKQVAQSFSSSSSTTSSMKSMISSSSTNNTSKSSSVIQGSNLQKLQGTTIVAPPKTAPPPPPITDNGVVKAVPAMVVPDMIESEQLAQTEIIIDKQMRVRDRIKKIEKQLSTEDPSAAPPDVIMPRGRSGSIRNLAEQFEQQTENPSPAPMVNAHAFKVKTEVVENGCDFKSVKEIASSFDQTGEQTKTKTDVVGEFKSIKDVAAVFQDPIQPISIKPPPAFMSEGEQEEQPDPVPVLPPATMRKTIPSPPPKPPSPAIVIPPPIPISIPVPQTVPAVPSDDVKPTEPPPVPWRKNRDVVVESTDSSSEAMIKNENTSVQSNTLIENETALNNVINEINGNIEALTSDQTNGEVISDAAQVTENTNFNLSNELKVESSEIMSSVSSQVITSESNELNIMKTSSAATNGHETVQQSSEQQEIGSEKILITKTPVPAEVSTTATNDSGFEEALAEMSKYSETLSQTSAETESRSTSAETVVQQPIQYSAQVKCEVRSRVNTPDITEQVQNSTIKQSVNETKTSHQSRTESRTSSSSSTFASAVSSSSSTSNLTNGYLKSSSVKTNNNHINSSAKSSTSSLANSVSSLSSASLSSMAPPAATGKPPKAEPVENGGPPKFSLLRSASTGSMGSANMGGMTRTGSDKDIPKFNVKKLKANTRVWTPGHEDKSGGPTKLETTDLPSFKEVPPVWQPARAGSASPSLGRKEYRKVQYDGSNLSRPPSQENINAPRPEDSFAWRDNKLPKVQNPTVTLLQKRREGVIPDQRPDYLKPDEGYYKPDEKLYTIKREYESEDEEGSRRFAVLSPRKAEGVGPITRDGTPTSLKSGVRPEHQGEWYKRMFDSLHKVRDARYGGYMSEPEGYESDVGSSKYATLDRRRPIQFLDTDPSSATLPRNANRYIHQPGRIEDYVPGYSSLSEKELKSHPDTEVIIESKNQQPPPNSFNHRYGSKSQMSHALKESGYESDSTLVFKKRDDRRYNYSDPRKTSQLYRQIQRGGEIPHSGLQKPAPPRPKESPHKYDTGEVNIHYRSPIKLEQKESIPDEELQRRQEEHMKKVYEQERRKKYLAELEDIEKRRHTDNFTPLQKSPIPLNRYDDESYTMRGRRTPESKQIAKAMFNFTAQNKRELTFNKGDILTIRRKIDKNWYEGEFRGTVGIFPCNYVEIIAADELKTLNRKSQDGQARARFNFQAQTSLEMTLNKGELVTLTRRVDDNWYEGRVGNRKGIFPVTYVDTMIEPGSDRPMTPSTSPMPRPALPAANLLHNGASTFSSPYSTLGRPGSQNDSRPYNQSLTVNTQQDPIPYRALYNYKPQNDDELELQEGDIVLVMEKCDDGWYVGTSRRTGLFGTFPGNYVDKM